MKSMNHAVRRFKSLNICLEKLEPFIRDGEHLRTGKTFEKFGDMRSREILANWLICAVLSSDRGYDVEFTTDPIGSDGILRDPKTEQTWPTEHVIAMAPRGGTAPDVPALILNAVQRKQNKGGKAYAEGKTLIVFLEIAGGGTWLPNNVARALPKHDFVEVWSVGLQGVESEEYVYNVTLLKADDNNAPAWTIRIAKDFKNWSVTRIQ